MEVSMKGALTSTVSFLHIKLAHFRWGSEFCNISGMHIFREWVKSADWTLGIFFLSNLPLMWLTEFTCETYDSVHLWFCFVLFSRTWLRFSQGSNEWRITSHWKKGSTTYCVKLKQLWKQRCRNRRTRCILLQPLWIDSTRSFHTSNLLWDPSCWLWALEVSRRIKSVLSLRQEEKCFPTI